MFRFRAASLVSVLSAVVLSLLLGWTSIAHAYQFNGYKWATITAVRFTSYIQIPELSQAFFDAKSDWDNTPTRIGLYYDAANPQVIGRNYSAADGYDAYWNPVIHSNGYLSLADIWLNWNYLSSKSTNYRRGTAGHEWGHTFGLAHESGQMLMSITRNRETVITPQSDDIQGINALYPGHCCAPEFTP